MSTCSAHYRCVFFKPPKGQNVGRILKRLHHRLAPARGEVQSYQLLRRLRGVAWLFDEIRSILRLASDLPENETEQDLEDMQHPFAKWISSLKKCRSTNEFAAHVREGIDIIIEHALKHGDNLWGHAIPVLWKHRQ